MKRIFIIIMLALAVAVKAHADTSLYEKCEKQKSLTTVYVTRAMLDMVVNTQPLDERTKALLSENIDNVLMQINDGKENVNVYQKKISFGNNQYVVSVRSEKESVMIVMEGMLKLEDMVRMTGVMDKNRAKSKLKSAKPSKPTK